MITNQQATNLETRAAAARGRLRQDKTDPLLINLEDGRLMPNVPNIRKNPKYVIYSGDFQASKEERMLWLASVGRRSGARRVVDSREAEPFDIATASKTELADFALTEYGEDLKTDGVDIRIIRAQVKKLATQFNTMVEQSLATAAASKGRIGAGDASDLV
jgi:hypothetical protein